MKLNRTNIFIVISSLALVVVLFIQVNWLLKTAKIKEELFNEKANMVLAKTTEALFADEAICKKLETSVEKNELHKIDSLLNHFMTFYNFHINYSFKVIQSPPAQANAVTDWKQILSPDQPGCHRKNLEEVISKKGWELQLFFPKKKQFIIAEMSTMFITSVVLILVVLVLFWRTTLSLLKEKKISDHTTDFLNNMTHEFKTPLTNIALAGKMILKDTAIEQEDKIKHYSGIILQENEKLKLQVEQVLSMTALEKGEIPLQKINCDFHQLITDALKCMNLQMKDKKGNCKLNLNADKYIINGDKTHLTNALCNLIDNAIKYSKERPDLFIQTYNSGENIIISVSDKGIGIEKEYHSKIFDKFFRIPTGDVHDVKGFGLGLSYIKKIIELHHGTIEIESKKGIGTSFTITLPYA